MSGNSAQLDSSSQAAEKPRRRLTITGALIAVMASIAIYLAGVSAAGTTSGHLEQNVFSLWMFLVHIALGTLLLAGGFLFGAVRCIKAHKARDWRARNLWLVTIVLCLLTLLSGGVLFGTGREISVDVPAAWLTLYVTHLVAPLLLLGLCLWSVAARSQALRVLGTAAALFVVLMFAHGLVSHREAGQIDAAQTNQFAPALTQTQSGDLLSAGELLRDQECLTCHADVHADWSRSAHRFSSFNNPPYLATVLDFKRQLKSRDGHTNAVRFCAGCHDPVPLLSGALDDPEFDEQSHPTSQAGITCTVCHGIVDVGHVDGSLPVGNGDYTIAAPEKYPLSGSKSSLMQWAHERLLLTKPALHKRTFLKPLHHTAEFCATCHKVHIPEDVNHYKYLRGQNHFDSFLLSGVSGHSARSFYYPQQAAENCQSCHMPSRTSSDVTPIVRNHLFPAANTGLPAFRGDQETVSAHRNFLLGSLRIDVFGIREEKQTDGTLHAPLRPHLPTLQRGKSYLFETVIRNLRLGHHFTQGTADSNQIWLQVTVTDGGGRVIGQSGAVDSLGKVDPGAHFVNAFVVDRNGKRINRRNAQDIFVPLYNNQIPPGAADVVHYGFRVPEDAQSPLTFEVRLNYRKFDREYQDFVADTLGRGDLRSAKMPIVEIDSDRVSLPIGADGETPAADDPPVAAWERWNDYGIGLLQNGRAELRQAESAFRKVENLDSVQGSLNLARVLLKQGRLDEAESALGQAKAFQDDPAPWWTLAWLHAQLEHQRGNLPAAEKHLRRILAMDDADLRERGFDFSRDYVVNNQLGRVLFDRARRLRTEGRSQQRDDVLRDAAAVFERTLELDSENLTAHYNLAQLYTLLGNEQRAARHRQLSLKYKPDDNARGEAIRAARERYPAANHAAADIVIYDLPAPAPPNGDQ